MPDNKMSVQKIKCPNCGKKVLLDKLYTHRCNMVKFIQGAEDYKLSTGLLGDRRKS